MNISQGIVLTVHVVAAALANSAIGTTSYIETFDGPGYTVGQDLPDPPWGPVPFLPDTEPAKVSPHGFNGTQGASQPYVGIFSEEASGAARTGVTGAAFGFTFSWMLYEDANDIRDAEAGNQAFLTGGLISDYEQGSISLFRYVDNDNTMSFRFSQGPEVGGIIIADDTWYQFVLTGTPADGGWNVKVEHRTCSATACAGPFTTDIPETLWAPTSPFVPAYVIINMEGQEGRSGQDNLIVADIIPEPGALALLGPATMMLLAARRHRPPRPSPAEG